MKIVILDSETVSRNDVSLEGITVLGESIVYGFTPNEQVAEKIGDADAVICNKCLITEEVFSKCKNLKYVGLFATGYNNVDLSATDRHGAVVCNVPAIFYKCSCSAYFCTYPQLFQQDKRICRES